MTTVGFFNKSYNVIVDAFKQFRTSGDRALHEIRRSMSSTVQAPECNAPLIRFLISALYIIIICLFVSYASPVILLSLLFPY